MKRVSLLCAVVVAALLVPSAKAETFDISFDGGTFGFSGSGVFEATGSGGMFTVGSVDSGSVTDPYFGTSAIVSISSTYAQADNSLFYPSSTYFDDNGLSFNLANGLSINLFYDGSAEGALESNVNGDIEELVTDTVSPAVAAATPEPSSFVLLGTAAMMGMGDLVRRRRRSIA